MTPRLVKQLLYGAFYLILFGLLSYGVYLKYFQAPASCFDNRQNQGETGVDCGGPCGSCELKKMQPIESDWVKYFPADNKTIVVFELKNPNNNYGAEKLNYSIDVIGNDGGLLKNYSGDSFIYASEIKYIFSPLEIDSQNIKNVKVSFSGIQWKLDSEFSKPNTQARSILTAQGKSGGIEVSGTLINNNAFPLSKIKIIGFLFNSNGIQVGVSKTEFSNINSFDEIPFSLIFPKNISLIDNILPPYSFASNLTIGIKSNDVKKLAEFLASQNIYSDKPTTYFSQNLKKALTSFQKKNGILPANGYFGPKTREYVNNLLSAENLNDLQKNLSKADPSKTEIYVEALK